MGRATLGGFLPKPVFWDCALHLDSWQSRWSEEKQSWCCAHYRGAHAVCAKITVSHQVHFCDATTAGGVPCNFPFRYSGKKHYGCLDNNFFSGKSGSSWCMRVDGQWSMCDCQPEDFGVHHTVHKVIEDIVVKPNKLFDKGEFAPGMFAVDPCPSDLETQCPQEWTTSDSGGFFCHSDKGCRPANEGPFPEESCQAQCSLGTIYVPGGGDVAVPFDCTLHLHHWKSRWSHTKRRWCCEHSQEGQIACGAEDSSSVSGHLRECPKHVRTSCPEEWSDPRTKLGGFYCYGDGSTQGGCREALHGPFPVEDCKEQCYIGEARIGGFLPTPVLYDCQRHLDHWDSHWSKEKQYWCCTHDRFARQVCGHISVSHKMVTSCDATTAGGIPCDFPYEWGGKKHYSCTVDNSDMGGQPWCVRVDGTWADCDCQGFGAHVISIDVKRVHRTHPIRHEFDLGDEDLSDWRPEGDNIEGIDRPFDCPDKDAKWTEVKKQWCCDVDADCTPQVSEFDCLADFSTWGSSWSLEKKVWCFTSGDHHELFDCDEGIENADRGWSSDKLDWCCRKKQKGCKPLFDCDHNLDTWETSWEPKKKQWCWDKEHKGFYHPYKCKGTVDEQKWPEEKQEWCCKNQHVCVQHDYDCEANYATWQIQWTAEKKHYCCQKEGKGCYDCNAGLRNWERGWSHDKKAYCCTEEAKNCYSCLKISESPYWGKKHREYCCESQNVACHDCSGDVKLFKGLQKEWCCEQERRCHPELTTSTTASTTNCPDAISSDNPAYCNTPIGTWPEEKREYCCKHYGRGCPQKQFDCHEDYHHWKVAWSDKKKEWCCAKHHVGCKSMPNCHTAPTSWSPAKQQYCCEEIKVGCQPYLCRDGSSPETWTHDRRAWCCAKEDIGCVPEAKPDLQPEQPHGQYDCLEGVSSWRDSWSPGKKEYCCRSIQVGCVMISPPRDPEEHPGCSAKCHWDSEEFSCGERIKYAAAHRFRGQKHACMAAHHLVAGECDFCSQCTVQRSGCYVFWHHETHHTVTTHTVAETHRAFHCDDGPVGLWPKQKKQYCCAFHRKGCSGQQQVQDGYDCNEGFDKWEINWDARQKVWCCKHQQKACARFQCDLDLSNFQTVWGPPKKMWCCEHEKRGCVPGFIWFDCNEEAEHWESVWKAEKKAWCCSHEKKGCPGWKWTPPQGILHVIHTTYTTHHVANGGHWDVGFKNSWHHEGEWHQGHPPAASGGVHGAAHGAAHGSIKFNCHKDSDHWEDRWSPPQKHWCWVHYHIGYHQLFNCHVGQATAWSIPKKNWCCTQLNICHSSSNGAAFDCNAALGNWERAWSPAKKNWCWTHMHKGGPPGGHKPPPLAAVHVVHPPAGSAWGAAGVLPGSKMQGQFNCAAALQNWEDAWCPQKKVWCWRHQRVGGPERFNCHTQVARWSGAKRSWCCENHRNTCPDRRLSEIFT